MEKVMSKKNNMTIAAVIVTYNRRYLLEECLNAVLNQQEWSCEAIVVDNASSDETYEYMSIISAENERIHYYRLDKNIGGSGGFNYGMKKAVQLGADYIWMMDDDCIPEPDALRQLVFANQLIGNNNYGFLSSAVFWLDGTECKMNRQKITKAYYQNLDLLKEGIIRVDQGTFVSMFISRQTVIKVGLPIKEFFIWGDDIEYSRRIAVRHNIPSFLVGKSTVVHKTANNEGSSIVLDDANRIERYNFAYRNDNYTYRKEGLKGFTYYTGKCVINVLRIIMNSKNHKLKRSWVVIKNFFAGLTFNPRIECLEEDE